MPFILHSSLVIFFCPSCSCQSCLYLTQQHQLSLDLVNVHNITETFCLPLMRASIYLLLACFNGLDTFGILKTSESLNYIATHHNT